MTFYEELCIFRRWMGEVSFWENEEKVDRAFKAICSLGMKIERTPAETTAWEATVFEFEKRQLLWDTRPLSMRRSHEAA